MKAVSLIPARGGSKRIPRKNLTILNGKPLIYYTIKASLDSPEVDETWVSSDDKEILNFADVCGAKALVRPEYLAIDKATTDDVIIHFCNVVDFDIVVVLQPTSPMIESIYIDIGIQMIKVGKYDSVFSSVPMHEADILFWESVYGGIKSFNYDLHNRRVRNNNYKIETGSFYISTKERILDSKCRLSGRIGTVDIPFWKSFEVDTIEDLRNVEKLMRD